MTSPYGANAQMNVGLDPNPMNTNQGDNMNAKISF